MRYLAAILLVFFTVNPALAQDNKEAFKSTGYPVPRFVSLRSDEVYARTGPGKQYPVRYIYTKKKLPVEIVLEFEGWRKIRDITGDEGWVHGSLLTGNRTAIVQSQQGSVDLLRKADTQSKPMVQVESGAVVSVEECIKGDWCKVSSVGYEGWLKRKYLWGVYENEFFD